MPPKKKQDQIDLATLPECVSANGILFCQGKKQRSDKILSKIYDHYKNFISKISRQEVLDHAKEKNIYVDPSTLTDKQKKDSKFMESVCTELTPEVVAKATKSFIQQLSVKIRLDLKVQNDKPQQQRAKPVLQKKMDQFFLFSPDFFQSKQEYESLATVKQDIKYIIIINPVVSWANAPQMPPEIGEDQSQEQDGQIKQLKELQAKEQFGPEDHNNNSTIQKKLQQIRTFRSDSNIDSPFRDCIIDILDCEVDVYNEEQSINQILKIFTKRLSKLYSEYNDFLEWKKERTTVPILNQNDRDKFQSLKSNQSYQRPPINVKGTTAIQILSSFVDYLYTGASHTNQDEQNIESLIQGFDFDNLNSRYQNSKERPQRKDKKIQFFCENQSFALPIDAKNLQQENRSQLKYPGMNRYLMPDIPLKSGPLRKLQQSYYSQYLSQNLPYSELERRLSLIRFEQILKQVDQERKYSFLNRVYEENHDEKSLMRELYRALSLYGETHFISRYNEENDKLYLVLMYKNSQRRLHRKLWEASWKVLPNYEFWLKHFRENDSNLSTQSFYDIDYEKIGNINSEVSAFSVPDGGVMISKKATIANVTNQFLYGIKNHHIFGLTGKTFFSENNQTRVTHFSIADHEYETQVLTGENITIRLKPKTGDIVIKIIHQNTRIHTPDGYTVVYADEQSKKYKIFHPTGGVTEPNCYINEKGWGVKNGIIHNVPTLLRRAQNQGYEIIKRDDGTVIINQKDKKWIKFCDGTQYLLANSQISIEKKNYPFVKCTQGKIRVELGDLTIKGQKADTGVYKFNLEFSDGNSLTIQEQKVTIGQILSQIPYIANIETGEFTLKFGGESLRLSPNNIEYMREGKSYSVTEKQENFQENQKIPEDYIEPKLFIIDNNNTGKQYLSQKQLDYYFQIKSHSNQNIITQIQNSDFTQNVHVITKILDSAQLHPKKIHLNLKVDFDVFKYDQQTNERSPNQKFTIRSFIKHKSLSSKDQLQTQSIKEQKQEWFKNYRKDCNEFGHKPKADLSTQKLSKQKLVMIDFRKKQLPEADFQILKSQAIKQWKHKQKLHLTMIAKQEEEDEIRMKLNKKQKSIIQKYPPLVISPKQMIQQEEKYSPAGFYSHYFQTSQGKKALAEMPEWVFRPKTSKQPRQLDTQIVTDLNIMNKTKKQEPEEQIEKNHLYDTVDVILKPVREIYIKPSVFTQRQIDEERFAFQQEKNAYFYHEKKRKDFNVYGNQRKDKIQVNSLIRTQPMSEINQKYLITEAPLDKRIKISSMKNKLTSQASTLIQMRKQGPHHTLLKTIDKRNDYNTLLEKRTMMVHADLNDKLQRDILINPVMAEFGSIKEGKSYQIKINVKNEDILAQRLIVKKPRNINVKAMLNQMGPIALGMSRKVIVQIAAFSDYVGKFTDEFQIVSKHEVYKIPVNAHILSQIQFQNQGAKLLPWVKQIQQFPKKKGTELPRIG